MKTNKNHNLLVLVFALLFASAHLLGQSSDSTLSYPFFGDQSGGMLMNAPGNIKSHVNYDILNNQYTLQNKVGELS